MGQATGVKNIGVIPNAIVNKADSGVKDVGVSKVDT